MSLQEELARLSLTELVTLQDLLKNKIYQVEEFEPDTIENRVLLVKLTRAFGDAHSAFHQEIKEEWSLSELREVLDLK